MKPQIVLLILLLSFSTSFAQNRNASFYFGTRMGYNTVEDKILPTKDYTTISPFSPSFSCISDEQTGALLFYTNGSQVYDANHQQMNNGILTDSLVSDVLIVPDPASASLYYIFYTHNNSVFYAKVDFLNKAVISKENLLMTNTISSITAVTSSHKTGWWLITHSPVGNTYYAFLIEPDGIHTTPVVSNAGSSLAAKDYLQILVSSHKGDRLLIIKYNNASIRDVKLELLDFDKKCGTFTNARTVISVLNNSIRDGVFSPDDSKIYVVSDRRIIQYSGNDYKDSVTIATTPSFSALFTAADNTIYAVELGNRIYRINQPDAVYPGCNYSFWRTILPIYSNIELAGPRQIMDRSPMTQSKEIDFTVDYACTRFKAEFKAINDQFYDSLRWSFGDTASPDNSSTVNSASHVYDTDGDYTATLIAYSCAFTDTVSKVVKVRDRLNPKLGNDTTICFKDSILLVAKVAADSFLWSNGSKGNYTYTGPPGPYWVEISLGDCRYRDTIVVEQYPDIWTALGDEYLICTDANELIKLDAGEGFQTYKWIPTGDTTQWIDVAEVKDYFVIVKDYRGCRGADGTKVKRRCPSKVFFPNAFTPNNDGLNDEYIPIGVDVTDFFLIIYNRWGEKVFETNSLEKHWDGTLNHKPAQDGVYTYYATYKGYLNKHFIKSFSAKGNITLLR